MPRLPSQIGVTGEVDSFEFSQVLLETITTFHITIVDIWKRLTNNVPIRLLCIGSYPHDRRSHGTHNLWRYRCRRCERADPSIGSRSDLPPIRTVNDTQRQGDGTKIGTSLVLTLSSSTLNFFKLSVTFYLSVNEAMTECSVPFRITADTQIAGHDFISYMHQFHTFICFRIC